MLCRLGRSSQYRRRLRPDQVCASSCFCCAYVAHCLLAECRTVCGSRRAMGGCQSLQLLDCFHQSKHSYNNNNRKHQYSCPSSSYWPWCLCCCCCRCCHRPLANRPSDGDDVDSREAFPTWRPDSSDSTPIAQVWFLRPPTVAAESAEVTDGDQAELSPLLQSSNSRAASPCRTQSPFVRLIQVVQTADQTNELDSDALVVPDVSDSLLKDADQLSNTLNQVERFPGSPPPPSGHLTAALSDFWNELGHTLQCLSYSTPVVCQVSRQMNGIAPTRLSILPASPSTTSFPFPPALPPTPPSPPLPPSPTPSRDSLSRQPFAIRSRRKFIRVSSLREHSGKSLIRKLTVRAAGFIRSFSVQSRRCKLLL